MRLMIQIEDTRFEGMGFNDEEILDIIKTEIVEGTYPLGELMTDLEQVEAKPITASGVVASNEAVIEEAVNSDLMPLRKIHGAA